jgi:hypothetical protein
MRVERLATSLVIVRDQEVVVMEDIVVEKVVINAVKKVISLANVMNLEEVQAVNVIIVEDLDIWPEIVIKNAIVVVNMVIFNEIVIKNQHVTLVDNLVIKVKNVNYRKILSSVIFVKRKDILKRIAPKSARNYNS